MPLRHWHGDITLPLAGAAFVGLLEHVSSTADKVVPGHAVPKLHASVLGRGHHDDLVIRAGRVELLPPTHFLQHSCNISSALPGEN